jgi:hypothetical protein
MAKFTVHPIFPAHMSRRISKGVFGILSHFQRYKNPITPAFTRADFMN